MRFEYSPSLITPKIVDVLEAFSLHLRKDGSEEARPAVFDSVAEKVKSNVADNAPVSMVLPAFPWKNPNRDKVLGPDPDLGDELGLSRLNDLCQEISKVYPYGARITLICDGPVYNDLVGVLDEECYDYGLQLRSLAQARGFSSIQFTRLSNLMNLGDGENISKIDYLRLVPTIRKKLMSSKYLDPKFDMERELQSNPDTKLTYQSYFSRISEDLKWAKGLDTAVASNPTLYDAEVSRVTIQMMRRLIAYEALINSTSLSKLIRLSIHPSLGKSKISIPLLPQGACFGDMPWHGSVLMLPNGQIMTGNAQDFRSRYEIVFKNGKPYAFRQPSPLYDWSADVEFQYGYKELLVKNPRKEVQCLEHEDRLKLARLIVLLNDKTVRVEGFALPGGLLTEV